MLSARPKMRLQSPHRAAARAGVGGVGRNVVDVEADLRRAPLVERRDVERALFAVGQDAPRVGIGHLENESVFLHMQAGLMLALGAHHAALVRAVHVEARRVP